MSKISRLDGGAIDIGNGGAVEGVLPSKSVGSGATGASGSSGTDEANSESSDSVSITSSGRTLAALSQAVQASPEVDESKVATLQQAVESGSYAVDSNAIAGGMLRLEKELGGAAQ